MTSTVDKPRVRWTSLLIEMSMIEEPCTVGKSLVNEPRAASNSAHEQVKTERVRVDNESDIQLIFECRARPS